MFLLMFIGAAIGPFLTGLISPTGWQNVFYMLIASNLLALTVSQSKLFSSGLPGWHFYAKFQKFGLT